MEETVQKAMEWGALCRHVPQAVCSEPPGWGSGECDGDTVDFLVAERKTPWDPCDCHHSCPMWVPVSSLSPGRGPTATGESASRGQECVLTLGPDQAAPQGRQASWRPCQAQLGCDPGSKTARIFFFSGTYHIHNHTFYVREWLFKTVFNSESELIVRMQSWS